MMATPECPSCGGMVNIGFKPIKGQLLTCPHCKAELEIIQSNPVELDWAFEDFNDPEDEEEWD